MNKLPSDRNLSMKQFVKRFSCPDSMVVHEVEESFAVRTNCNSGSSNNTISSNGSSSDSSSSTTASTTNTTTTSTSNGVVGWCEGAG